jgi:hypothetical protein
MKRNGWCIVLRLARGVGSAHSTFLMNESNVCSRGADWQGLPPRNTQLLFQDECCKNHEVYQRGGNNISGKE